MSIAVELPGHVVAIDGDGARRGRTIYGTIHGRRARRACARTTSQHRCAPVESTAASHRRPAPFQSMQQGQWGQRATFALVGDAVVSPHPEPAVRVADVQKPTQAANAEAMGAVRLTSRGQGAVLVVAAVLALAVVAGSWASQRADAPATSVPTPAHVAVMSGDTLWSIASRVAPGRDPRAEIDDLLRLNDLTDAALVPGQVLRVR